MIPMQRLTEIKWNYLLLKSNFFGVLFLVYSSLSAQELKYQVTVGETEVVDIDRQGAVYVVDNQGNITKWVEGVKHLWYSPEAPAEVQIDASAMLTTVIFSPDWQGIRILGQQLTLQTEYIFDPNLIEYASIASNGSDGGIWLYDQTSFRLKKYFPNVSALSIDVPLEQLVNSSNWNPIWIREYQNNLYVLDAYKGVYTFDLLGNILSKPQDVERAQTIGLTAKEMYWVKKDEVNFKALYSIEKRSISLPIKRVEKVLYDDNTKLLYCFKKEEMYVYQL